MIDFKYFLKMNKFLKIEELEKLEKEEIIFLLKLFFKNLKEMELIPYNAESLSQKLNIEKQELKEIIRKLIQNEVIRVIELNLIEEKEERKEIDFNNFYGDLQNVYLAKREYDLLRSECLNDELLQELIESLSEAIAIGKYERYDKQLPHAHYVLLKKFLRYRKLNPKKFIEEKEEKKDWMKEIIKEVENGF